MRWKVKILLMAVIVSLLVAGCATPAQKTVKAGDMVSVEYVGRYTNGTIFDTTNVTLAKNNGIYDPGREPYGPISFEVGSGRMIPGFEKAVIGMKANETRNVTLSPAEAYGAYNSSLVITTRLKSTNASDYAGYVGQQIEFNGELAKLVSIDPVNNTMTLDYNNPMAGKSLVFDITLVAINPGASPAT